MDDSLCPYLGLDAFREKDRQFFYGRQRLLEQLIKKLEKSPLLAVVGSSGSGKSSVLLGGLIPSLKARKLPGSENWHYYVSMVPGSNPLANLARLFCPKDIEKSVWVKQQTEQLLGNSNHLTRLLSHEDGQPSVLVIDQFEEMFTLCLDEAKRHAFIENILGVIQFQELRHRVILTMRSDFESRVAKMPTFYPYFEKAKVYVIPLDAGELREAIEEPAKLVGLKFEEGLVDKLIQDVLGESAALPLLQFTLLKLWDNRERNRITQEAYQKLGGCRLALSNSADEFYKNLIPQKQEICKRIFLKMVRPTIEEYDIPNQPTQEESQGASKNKIVGWEVTSSRIRKNELYQTKVDQANVEEVLDELKKAHLIKITQGDSNEDIQVEVAHEALIRNWFLLRYWLNDERENLRDRLCLEAKAKEWEATGKDQGALLRGALLEQFRQYDDLTELETEFVNCSIKYEQKIIKENEERLRLAEEKVKLQNRIMIILIVASVICLGLAIAAKKAEENTQNADLNTQLAELKAKIAEQEAKDAQSKLEDINKEKNQAEPSKGQRASAQERKGFKSLLAGNLKDARVYFYNAYFYFPTYHNVDEIFNRLLTSQAVETYSQADEAQRAKQLSIILGQILTQYSWGMPSDIKKDMQVKFLNIKNYQIGIYYYSQGGESPAQFAKDIRNKLIEFGLLKQDDCSSFDPVAGGVCHPGSKDSIWFQVRLSGNTIRYYQNTEYEVAYVLQQVLAEIYPQKKFKLLPVTTPTPNSITIFVNYDF